MKDKIVSIILDEVVQDEKGNVIATKELINEVTFCGEYSECVTREVIKFKDAQIVINNILHKSKFKKTGECQTVDFIGGNHRLGEWDE